MGSRRQSSDDAAAALVGGVILVVAVVAVLLVFRALTEVIRIYRDHARPGSVPARLLWQALGALGCAWAVAATLAVFGLPEAGALLAAWAFLTYTVFVSVVDERFRVKEKEQAKPADQLEQVLHWPLPEPQMSRVNGVHP